MLGKLLYKEFRLALHPTVLIFAALAAMVLIPSYPLYVVFFYTSLGLFFVCVSGRENHDLYYTLSLPVKKSDAVAARFLFVLVVEAVQLVFAGAFCFVRDAIGIGPNSAGMDPNLAFFGLSFVLFGIFNLVFLTGYFKTPDKVGRVFAIASTATFLYIGAAEAASFAIPFFRNRLDTPGAEFLGEKLTVFFIGLAVYAALTYIAYRRSVKTFDALDM